MKKLVCGTFGTIYYARIRKNGLMSYTNRVDVTDDAIKAVLIHLMSQTEYHKDGYFGYQYDDASASIIAFDPKRYVLCKNVNEGKEE